MPTSLSPSTRRSALSNLPDFVTNPRPEIYVDDSTRLFIVDFEVAGEGFGVAQLPESRLLLSCWMDTTVGELRRTGARVHIHSHFGGEFDTDCVREAAGAAAVVVGHNVKYELGWLKRIGYDIHNALTFCTQLAEYVLAGNRRWPLNLDAVARRRGTGAKHGFVKKSIQSGVPVDEIPEGLLEDYCKQDVQLTAEIFLQQIKELQERDQLKTAYARNLVTPALADIEFSGVKLDEAAVRAEHDACFQSYASAAGSLDSITGGINFRSSKQLREFVYGTLGFAELCDRRGQPLRTGKGQPKTDKNTVEALRASTPEQRAFKQALKAVAPLKKRTQILDNMLKCCETENGIVFASFNQSVTQTHRLSSTGGKWGFQFHNFPRNLKPVFTVRNSGWYVVEADAPQLEFRVAADLGHDERALVDIRHGDDVHAFTAEVMGLSRQDAKAFTFKPLYGGNSGDAKAVAYFKAFREKYADIYKTQQGWVYHVLQTKELTLPSGLRFYWPDTEMQRSGYVTNTPSIFNYPVQSFATADIIPLTLVLVWHMVKGMELILVNTIHDSIIAEVPPDELDEYKDILKKAFTEDIYWLIDKLYNYKISVPLGVGIKSDTHWGLGKEEKYTAEIA